jgi:RNA polymerase sigma-70 factor (sigma-E family)
MPETAPGGQGFGDFVTAVLPALLRFGHVLTGSRVEAEDLVQEALARCLRRWRTAAADDPVAYVRRAMVNTYISGRRHWTGRVRLGEVPEHVADDGALRRCDDRDALRAALAALPRRQRAVLVLRYYGDLPDSAIAAMLGCRPVTVRSQAHRGLAALRPLLAETGEAHAR